MAHVERLAHLQRPYCACGRPWPCPMAAAPPASGALRRALERLVKASHRVQPDPLGVRADAAPVPRDRLIALWDAEHAARAALDAHRHTPDDEYDSPDERCAGCGEVYIRRHTHAATCTGTDCDIARGEDP